MSTSEGKLAKSTGKYPMDLKDPMVSVALANTLQKVVEMEGLQRVRVT